jgi:hypothetical protein
LIVPNQRQCCLHLCQNQIASIELRSRGIHPPSRVMQDTRRTNLFRSRQLLPRLILITKVHLLNHRL